MSKFCVIILKVGNKNAKVDVAISNVHRKIHINILILICNTAMILKYSEYVLLFMCFIISHTQGKKGLDQVYIIIK